MDYKNITTGVIGVIVGGGLIMASGSAPIIENGTVTYERIDKDTVKITRYIVNDDTITVPKLSDYLNTLQAQVENPGTGPMSKEGLVKVKDRYIEILNGANEAGVESAKTELDELIIKGEVIK
ncbi:MAG: hypothetical protein WC648_01305 [Candidatus Paceibacterota bacterium]|jgi:hypothetical protein